MLVGPLDPPGQWDLLRLTAPCWAQERETGPQGDFPDEAGRFRRLSLQDENGFIPPDGLEQARRHVEMMKAARAQRPQPRAAGVQPDSWTWLGPGNFGGRIRSIVIHPRNPSVMFVGSVSGGIWKTTNSGASWSPVDDFMANLAVSTMVINPVDPAIMYAGTGESFAKDGLQGAGVFKSTDGGATWHQLPATTGSRCCDAMMPTMCGATTCVTNAECIFSPPLFSCVDIWSYVNRLAISPDGTTLLAATQTGIWRSIDGGQTWTWVSTRPAVDIHFHPTDSNRAVVGEFSRARFTTDGGQTWTPATFNPVLAFRDPTDNGRIELAYAPSNPTTVYASINVKSGDLYRSTDGGQTYAVRSTGGNLLVDQGSYDNSIWVNPQDDRFLIVGGIQLWKSIDGGASLIVVSDGSDSPHADQHAIVSHPFFDNTTNRTVFIGNDGGIYRADDIGNVSVSSGWVNLNNNLGITQFYGAAANTNGVIVGGTQDNGTERYSGSTTWTMPIGADGGQVVADQTDPNYFYAEQQYLALMRSSDAAQTFSSIAAGLTDASNCVPGVCNSNFVAPLVLDPNEQNTLLAGGLSLWRSTDVREPTPTWTAIKPGIAGNSPISAIAVASASSAFIVVGHNVGAIFSTTTGKAPMPVWTKIDKPGTPARFVTRLAVDSTRSPYWIYVTYGGFSADNVFRTTDLGATWTDITGTGTTGLPRVPVRSLVLHPRNPNFIYVGTEVGVFSSEDAGATWDVPQDGPANVSVDELFWTYDRDIDLIAATHGRGLFRASGGMYVDCNYAGVERGTLAQPFRTVTAAVNATTRFQTIWIRPCIYNEVMTIDKRLELRGLGGTATIGGN